MSRQARVTVAYATVKVLDPVGKPTVYGFHQGAVFPVDADPEDVARLVRRGYAEWVDPAEAVDKQDADGATAEQAEAPEQGASTDDGPQRPATAAPKADWVAYAVAVRPEGMSEEDAAAAADAKTKAELIAEYGG